MGLTVALAIVLAFPAVTIIAAWIGIFFWESLKNDLIDSLIISLILGLLVGSAIALTSSQTWPATLAFLQLHRRGIAPARFMRFLEDARMRSVLRTAGPVYQFRHARLQDRLADSYRRQADAPPSPAPRPPSNGVEHTS
jgi:hypothetical protein